MISIYSDLFIPIMLLSVIFFVYISICIHEFGHTLAGLIVGFSIINVTIGSGRELIRTKIGNMHVIFRWGIGGGLTQLGYVTTKFLKFRYFLYLSGGLITQIIVVILTIQLYRLSFSEIHFQNLSLALVFTAVNLILIIVNLFPIKHKIRGNVHLSDGLQLITLPLTKPQEILAASKTNLAVRLYEEKNYQAAEVGFKEASELSPKLLMPKLNLSSVYIKQNKIREAIAYLEGLPENIKKDPNAYIIYNNLAWAYLLVGDTNSIEKANDYSCQAFKLNPKNIGVIGTRGCVLIETGAVEEGIELLEKDREIEKPLNKKVDNLPNITYLAYGYFLKKDIDKAEQYLQIVKPFSSSLDNDYKIILDRISRRIVPNMVTIQSSKP